MVDYSVDPLEGVDIFGYSSHATSGCYSAISSAPRVPISSPFPPLPSEDSPLPTVSASQHLSLATEHFIIEFPSPPRRLGAPDLNISHAHLPSASVGSAPGLIHPIPSVDVSDLRQTYPNPPVIKSSGSIREPSQIPFALNRSPRDPGSSPRAENPTALRSKKSKCVRETAKDISVQIGDPSDFEESLVLARTTLVGHVRGRSFSAERLKAWANENWGGMFTVMPEVIELPRGWFSIHFAREEHTNTVLARFWHIESAPVLLKRWSPLFDPEREQIGAGPIWVRLPGLPIQYWSEEAFIKIGNALGTYLDYDRSYKDTNKKIMARILVDLDTREGLEGKMTLRWGSYRNVQPLDYEGVPFRCNKCRQIGHVYKDCPLVTCQNGMPKQTRPSAGKDHAPASIPSRTSDRTIETRSPLQKPAPNPPPPENMQQRNMSPPPMNIDLTVAADSSAPVSHPSSIPSTSAKSSVHYSSNESTMIHCKIPLPPPAISSGTPSLPLPSPPSSPPSSKSNPSHPYSLRPRSNRQEPPSSAGLGIVPLDPGLSSTRGRKTNLSKAIKNASAEVAAGRQATITGVLRAEYPPKAGSP